MDWLNECTSGESLPNGLYRTQIGIALRAVRLDGYLREIAATWQQGDADLPHLISQAPIRVATADSGRRRLYPVPGDLSRYIEIGAPLIKPAGPWVSVGFAGATRQGNRITWSRPQANLSIVHGGHFCKLDIELRNGYVPPNRQFAFPVSLVGLTRSGARILADGQTVMLLRPPVVYDASNPLDTRPITWTFGAIGGQTGVLFTLPSLAGMARPVVDPTFSSQPAAAAGVDSYIYQFAPDANYGLNVDITCGLGGAGQTSRGLLAFSLTGVPSNARLSLATVTLYRYQGYDTTAKNVALHRALTEWFEGIKSGAAPDAGQDGSTWNNRNANGSLTWGTAGGQSGTDYAAVATDTQSITASDYYAYTVTPDVSAWLAGTSNYGWWSLGVESGLTWSSWASSDHTTAAWRPLLTVEYTVPSGGVGRGRSTLCREGRNRWL